MTSGVDKTVIGLATPGTVVFATQFDADSSCFYEVMPRRRGDADLFVKWLLQGTLCNYYFDGPLAEGEEILMAQLFAEVIVNSASGATLSGSQLVVGTVAEGLMTDTSEWTLGLDLEPAMTDAILDMLAQRGPQFSEIVNAARDPGSTAGVARRAALDVPGHDVGSRRVGLM